MSLNNVENLVDRELAIVVDVKDVEQDILHGEGHVRDGRISLDIR